MKQIAMPLPVSDLTVQGLGEQLLTVAQTRKCLAAVPEASGRYTLHVVARKKRYVDGRLVHKVQYAAGGDDDAYVVVAQAQSEWSSCLLHMAQTQGRIGDVILTYSTDGGQNLKAHLIRAVRKGEGNGH